MKIPQSLHSDPRMVASLLHAHSGKFYDGYPYVYHLDMVYKWFDGCFSSLPSEKFAVYFHDTIEDCGLTYNDVKDYAGKYFTYLNDYQKLDDHLLERVEELADAVYRLTNLRGKTRKERQSDEWYDSLVQSPLAVKIKYADKLANLTHSIEVGSSMEGVYRKEWPEFHQKIMHRITPAVDADLRKELISAWNIVEQILNR